MTLLDPTGFAGKIFNGDWIKAGDGELLVDEPATGETLTSVGAASVADALTAATSAAAAQKA
jgi:benzaldehyde dehydrogenase (NAD)